MLLFRTLAPTLIPVPFLIADNAAELPLTPNPTPNTLTLTPGGGSSTNVPFSSPTTPTNLNRVPSQVTTKQQFVLN
jgi:hypothetical protein